MSEGRSEETKAAAEATPAAAGDAVDIEAGMAAFEARVAALNSQIEASIGHRRQSPPSPYRIHVYAHGHCTAQPPLRE